MRVVTHTRAVQLLRAGQAVTIRRRGEPLTLWPPAAIKTASQAPGCALVWWDGLPTLVRRSRIVPGDHLRAMVPLALPGRRASYHQSVEIPWCRVIGVGRVWLIEDLIV